MRPKTNLYKISRKELEALQIPSGTGLVLVHVPYKNAESRTRSGIYIVSDEDYKPALHAERWGYVYKISDSLYYNKFDTNSMPWKTEIEAVVGDKVWFDFRVGLYAYTYECEGEWYKMMEYQNLYVAKKEDGSVITLNGYVLFSEVEEDIDSDILLTTNIDKKYGLVEYVGSYNQEYTSPYYDDSITLEKGDMVLFEAQTSCFPLESGLHNEFSEKKHVLQHRKRVVAVVDIDPKKVLRMHDGVIGVKVKVRNLDEKEIKLLKDDKNHRIGVVEVSTHNNISKGDIVVLSKKKGTEFGGLEYVTEEKALYYETAS